MHYVTLALAQLSAAAFSGICLYIGLVQHPVRVSLTAVSALEDFRAVIPRAEKVQAPLLIVCLLAVASHLVVAPRWSVAVAGLLLLGVLGLTVATVLPINRRLLSGAAEQHLGGSSHDLARWGRLHAARTALAVLGTITLWI